jgi:hypothetical protein
MRAVRRFYFYAVAIISLEVVLWGVYTLVSSIINAPVGGGLANLLARGLAQILVGLPIFVLHWGVIQRDYKGVEEEQDSRIRALYNYVLRLATLLPVVTNLLAVLRRPLFSLFGVFPLSRPFLASQDLKDNILIIVINLIFWAYGDWILRNDWHDKPQSIFLEEIRRLYRYIWLILGIGSLVIAVRLMLTTIFYQPEGLGDFSSITLTNGIALALIATPIWGWTQHLINRSLEQKNEQKAILRVVVLFLVSLSAIALVLSNAGILASALLRWIFGELQTLTEFLNNKSNTISTLIPCIILWIYYDRSLKQQIASESDLQRKHGLQRLYGSILAMAGNIVVFIGLWTLLSFIADLWLGDFINAESFRVQLSNGLALLFVGIPLWTRTWPQLQKEAALDDDRGDHTRQSIVRKAFLYLIIFASVVGLMAAAGLLAYRLINAALGNPFEGLAHFTVRQIFLILLITIWLVYHLRVLRKDGGAAQKALSEQHAAFSTILLAGSKDTLMQKLKKNLNVQLPHLPVRIVTLAENPEIINDGVTAAVVLSSELTINLPEKFRQALDQFKGELVLLPHSEAGHTWVGLPERSQEDTIKESVRVLRQLAEGQSVKAGMPNNSWVIAGYIFGALFALELLAVLITFVMSAIVN